jgi:hypothetical protein
MSISGRWKSREPESPRSSPKVHPPWRTAGNQQSEIAWDAQSVRKTRGLISARNPIPVTCSLSPAPLAWGGRKSGLYKSPPTLKMNLADRVRPSSGTHGAASRWTDRLPGSQHSTLNTQHSTLNSQLSTLNSQLSTLNSQPHLRPRYRCAPKQRSPLHGAIDDLNSRR